MDLNRERADWPFIRECAVTLFWRKDLFSKAKTDVRTLGYEVLEVVCDSPDQVIKRISDGLNWSEQFGYEPWTGNLNALDEGLAGAPFPESSCFALCFEGYHQLVDHDRSFAIGLLDVVETQSRNHLVDGRRLIALVQTDDGSFETEKLGGNAARWNWQEWLNAARTLR